MAQLNSYVPVQDENLRTHVFGPGDDIPDWAVAKITNPHVWDDEPAITVELVADASAFVEAMASDGAPTLVESTVATSDAPPVPPKGGPNATTEAWAAYAMQEIATRGMNIDIPADAPRKDIIEALEGAGIPTE